jgi:hypothetical protein
MTATLWLPLRTAAAVFGVSDYWLLSRALAGRVRAHFLGGEEWVDSSSVRMHLHSIRRQRPPYRNPRSRPTAESIARLDRVLGVGRADG